MDLELCTGDGCKNWPTRELVPPKFSSWASWSVKHKLVPHSKPCLGSIGLSSCAEWILNFVQEMGVRTGPQGSWFHQNSLPGFLDLWSINWPLNQIASTKRKDTGLGTIRPPHVFEWILSFVQEMGVRTGPKGSWFHQKSLPEFLDLWSTGLLSKLPAQDF